MDTIKKEDIPKLFLSIIVCQSAGIVGSIFTKSSISSGYTTLRNALVYPARMVYIGSLGSALHVHGVVFVYIVA